MFTALITGGGSGLGQGFSEYLSSQGWQVFAGVRDLKKTASKFSNNPLIDVIKLDVTSDEDIQAAFEQIQTKTDHLDLLINNAALNKDSATDGHKELITSLKHLDRKTFLKMFNVNSVSPFLVLKTFLPLLNTDPCFVINISSNRASYNDPLPTTNANYGYRASKIALNMLTQASVFDLPKNVRTFAVHPGSVKTDMNPAGEVLPIKQAEKIIRITQNWKQELNGKYLNFDGDLYPL